MHFILSSTMTLDPIPQLRPDNQRMQGMLCLVELDPQRHGIDQRNPLMNEASRELLCFKHLVARYQHRFVRNFRLALEDIEIDQPRLFHGRIP